MPKQQKSYIKRPDYLNRAMQFVDKNLIKVFTGQRRIGKSYLMLQVMDEIEAINPDANIIFIDKELYAFEFMKTAEQLVRFVNEQHKSGKKNYLFIDEVQEIADFEKALRSFLNEGVVDIWCTGSNAQILSGELADRLSGRYIEMRVYGLSYIEFLTFHNKEDNADSLNLYMKYGGLPNLINLPMRDDVVFDYLKVINSTILLKDIVKRHQIRNVSMLENLIKFLSDNTGSVFSVSSISKFLKSQGEKLSPSIISNYLNYITDSYYLIKVSRSDMQGKRIFETNEKYYFEDLGLRNAWIGYQPMHIHKLLENAVLKHLVQQGFEVNVGIMGDKEVDFIAEKSGNRHYIQCAYLLTEESTREREFGNLLKIKDNFPKMVVSMDEPAGGNIQGIQHLHLRQFLKSQFD